MSVPKKRKLPRLAHVLVALATVLSLVSILCFAHSLLYPCHLSRVEHQSVNKFDWRSGAAIWFFEAERDRATSTTNLTTIGFSVGSWLGYRVSYGDFVSIWFAGVGVQWCWQDSGYRRFALMLGFFRIAQVGLILPTIWLVRRTLRRAYRKRRGLCLTCGYDLTGNVSGVCPECGVATKSDRGT